MYFCLLHVKEHSPKKLSLRKTLYCQKYVVREKEKHSWLKLRTKCCCKQKRCCKWKTFQGEVSHSESPLNCGKQCVGIYIYKYIYTNCNELAKEESVTKSNRKVSGIKITYGSKLLPKVKKQIKYIITYRHSTIQSCLFMHLIFLPFQTGSVNW